MAEDFKCNVLIMGITGTGKSSLLNYLCDSRIAKTGAGKPVTEEAIIEYPAVINGQEVRIFDSWGLEAGKLERWMALIDKSLKEHGVQKRMEDWFHSIIYCIQTGGSRVQDIDIEIIRRFLRDGYLLTVVLTKADQIKPEQQENQENQMRSTILNGLKDDIPLSSKGRINIISTCAEKKTLISGKTTHPFGREKVQQAILDGWKETVIERLPKHVVARLCEIVDEWKEDQIAQLSEKKVSGFHGYNQELYASVYRDAQELTKSIKDDAKIILDEAVKSCKKADTSLKVMLDVSLVDKKAPGNEPVKWWGLLFGIPVFIITGIPIWITQWIKSALPGEKEMEKQQLEDYISGLADEIKSNCQKLEPKIAKELNKSL